MVLIKNSRIFWLLIFSLMMPIDGKAEQESKGGYMIDLIRDIKKTIVFLGEVDEKGQPYFHATGFLVQIKGVFHLVTAKHVIVETKNGKFTGKLIDDSIGVFFNTKDGRMDFRSLNAMKKQLQAYVDCKHGE